MSLTDLIDITLDLLPRRATRAIGCAIVLGLLVMPGPTNDLFNWYAQRKAQQIVDIIQLPSPSEPPASSAG